MNVDFRTESLLEAIENRLDPDGLLKSAEIISERNGPSPVMHTLSEVQTPSAALEVARAVKDIEAAIVFAPGLGPTWTTGDLDEYRTMVRKYAERTSSVAIIVDWRSNSSTFSAGVDAVVEGLRWARTNHPELASHQVPLVVAGHGAGAGIAALAALRARGNRAAAPDLQFLICPALDAAAGRTALTNSEGRLVARKQDISAFFSQYAPEGQLDDSGLSSLLDADIAGVAPAIIATAENDLLLPEGEAYASRLRDKGLLVSYRSYAQQVHGFPLFIELTQGEILTQQLVRALIRYKRLGSDSITEGRFESLGGGNGSPS